MLVLAASRGASSTANLAFFDAEIEVRDLQCDSKPRSDMPGGRAHVKGTGKSPPESALASSRVPLLKSAQPSNGATKTNECEHAFKLLPAMQGRARCNNSCAESHLLLTILSPQFEIGSMSLPSGSLDRAPKPGCLNHSS